MMSIEMECTEHQHGQLVVDAVQQAASAASEAVG